MDLSNDDVLKILKIIDESGYSDVRLEIGDLKLHVQKQGAADADAALPFASSAGPAAPAAAPPSPSVAAAAPAAPRPAKLAAPPAPEPVPEGMVALNSPILGTFYRAPSPGEKPFVEVGQKVAVNDTLCLIEVMKLFNSVKAEVAGTVAKICVENGAMVEHGQVLMLIKPDA